MKKFLASEYLDDGNWGILNSENQIVIRISVGLTKSEAETVAGILNHAVEREEQRIQEEARKSRGIC